MSTPDYGPTVYEAAEARILRNRQKINELLQDNHRCVYRLANPAYRNMLEAERIASESEAFQTTPIPTL